ncbi:hypothetical protein Tco_0406868, partial [Tanacetum coccineum]
LISAGSTMILLVVILSAGCFVSAGSYGLCCWFRVHAGGHTSAGGFCWEIQVKSQKVKVLLSERSKYC